MINPIKVIKQDYNYCVPACLESIFSDFGINKTQNEIAFDNPGVFNGGVLIDSYKLGDVFKKYHVEVSLEQEDINKKYDFDCLKRIATNPNNKILLL
jgi:hypothetical protein